MTRNGKENRSRCCWVRQNLQSHLAAIKNLGDLAELVATVDVDTKRAKSSYEEYSTKRYYHCHKLKKE